MRNKNSYKLALVTLTMCLLSGIGIAMRTSIVARGPKATYESLYKSELSTGTLNLFGSYTGTVAINDPLALGILDISLTLTDTNGTLTGLLNGNSTLAYPNATTLQGSVITSNGITPTFRIDAAPFISTVSGRQVTRSFRIDGTASVDGNMIKGAYTETISGFTPQALIVNGLFLASRTEPLSTDNIPRVTPVTPVATATNPANPPTATPTLLPGPQNKRVYLPMVANKKTVLDSAAVVVTPDPTETPTPEPTAINSETTPESKGNTYLPLILQ